MQRKLLQRLDAEIETVARIRGLPVEKVVETVCEFIDYEYHGVVPLPLDESSHEVPGRKGTKGKD